MPIIGAIVCNAHSPSPEIEFEVVHEGADGKWYLHNEAQVWPFATLEVEFDPIIPEGWIEYLHTEAARFASNRPSPTEHKIEARSLLASLGLPSVSHHSMTGKLVRRV